MQFLYEKLLSKAVSLLEFLPVDVLFQYSNIFLKLKLFFIDVYALTTYEEIPKS